MRGIWHIRACATLAAFALAAGGALRARAGDAELTSALREASQLRDQGQYSAAEKKLHKLEDGDLAGPLGLARARLLHASGDLDGAAHTAEAAAAKIPASEIRAHLYAELMAIYLERGQLESAREAQRAASDTTRSTEVAAKLALELAQAYEAHGKPDDALALYTKLWQSYPLAAPSEAAFARTRALSSAPGAPPLDPSDLLARADRLRGAFRCESALPIYDALLAPGDPSAAGPPPAAPRLTLERSRAECLFVSRRYTDAAAAYHALAARDPKDMDARFQEARALARSGARDPAVAALEKLTRTKDDLVRARVRALLASILEDKEPARARAQLHQVERQTADPNLAAQARWSLAWDDLHGGSAGAAVPRLDKLAVGQADDVEVQRARYWRAVARVDTGDEVAKGEGETQLRKLAGEVPLSYYGMLAAERVGAPPIERPFVGPRVPEPEPPPLRRTRLFLDGGFPELATDEIESFVDDAKLSRDTRVATARLLHRAGDSFRALQVIDDGFGPSLEQGIDPAWREAWELAWPLAFGDSVAGAAREFAFDPALVWAIMREESAYRPEVSSPAGALGLMQLIPPTAGRVAGELGLTGFVAERLYDPGTNIRIGTYYLRSLVERWDGSRALAIASYNAGPEAVGRWLEKDADVRPDVFVETVTYGETRRYLRRVLRSYRMYQLLYGDAVAPVPAPASADAQREETAGR